MMTPGDRAALERLLAVPETAWLLDRVRSRVNDADGEPLVGTVRLDHPTEAQRAAVVRLLGRPRRPGVALRVDLGLVEEVLRRGPWPAGLVDAVITLTGPVRDTRAERDREALAWDRAYDGLAPAAGRFPGLLPWWEGWCARGGLKRAARAEAARVATAPGPRVGADLVAQAAEVLRALPASGEPRAVLARRVTGDAHGLDEDRPLGRLVLALVSFAFGPNPTDSEAVASGRGISARDTWAAAGVVVSSVASTVLVLGAPGAPDTATVGAVRASATAAVLEAVRGARMPAVLTLDQVRSGGVRALPEDGTIFVCENPSVVEVVADRWTVTAGSAGADAVLVCTFGQPSTAVIELLAALAARGAECRYHGDFDWAGLRIARSVGDRVPWTPWRFSAGDYEDAVHAGSLSRVLEGRPADSPWDPALAEAMLRHQVAVEEEAVADALADDVLGALTS